MGGRAEDLFLCLKKYLLKDLNSLFFFKQKVEQVQTSQECTCVEFLKLSFIKMAWSNVQLTILFNSILAILYSFIYNPVTLSYCSIIIRKCCNRLTSFSNKMIKVNIMIDFVKIFMLSQCYSHALSSSKILAKVTLQACFVFFFLIWYVTMSLWLEIPIKTLLCHSSPFKNDNCLI